jgi:mono/diheme cytochrome c family protein
MSFFRLTRLLWAAACVGLAFGALAMAASATEPPQVYVKNCAPCHSKDGKAKTPAARKLGVKDLSLSKLTDAQIAEAIREGKKDERNVSKMPAFKDKFTDEEIRLLVKTVKAFRNAP